MASLYLVFDTSSGLSPLPKHTLLLLSYEPRRRLHE